jgi:hypothetical protein
MILRTLATFAIAAALLSGCACAEKWAYFPDTLPYTLPGVERGTHITEAQAIELAISVAVYHRTNPANYASPKATYDNGEWHVFFGERSGPPTPALGSHFAVYVYERSGSYSFSPGR